MSEQKKNINCRICLRYDLERSQKCLSLFEKYNNSLIAEKIKYIANIEIKESDGLPGKICPECLLQLETAIVFKQKCETSNKILLSIIQQPSKICKVTFRVPIKKEADGVFGNKTVDYCIEDSKAETTKLEISKKKIPQHQLPCKVLPNIVKISNIIPHIIKPISCQNKKPENKEPVTALPVDVVLKNEEADYGISDVEELVIDTPYNEEVENETLLNDNAIHDSEHAGNADLLRPSRAIDLKLICDDCGGSFKSKCKLAVHWKKVHLLSKLVCPNCKRTFKSYKAFHVHKKKNTRSCQAATKVRIEGLGKKRVFHCNDCNYNTKSIKDMDAHLVTHSGDRRYQCKDCLKCFTQHASLQGHRESKHKDYRTITTCHYCGKVIQGRNKLYKHLRQHEPKSVQCEVCKKTLKSRAILINHMKRHTGVRSFTCETCSANFFTMGELCNHRRRVHFKAKIFKCDMCEYTAYTAALLNTHRSRHTHNNVACLLCGMFLENAEKLVIHQKRHAEKNYCCPDCDKGFFRRDSLRRHIMKKHGETKKGGNFFITVKPILS